MTRFLFVADPLDRVDPNADTTYDFIVESQARGVENLACEIGDLISDGAQGFALARPISIKDRKVQFGDAKRIAFDDCDAIWMRKDPPVDDAFMLATLMLDRHDPSKTVMMNRPSGLRQANEKLFALFAPELGPRTVVAANPAVLVAEVEAMGRGVLKPIGFAGGTGVMAMKADDQNLRAAADMLTLNGTRPALVQEYLPEARNGDKRVILLGGDPVGAVLRVPQANDHRANMHVGGSVKQTEVDVADRAIAAALKPQLMKLGLHFVGIDVIDGKLTEVNVTSPTGVQEIDQLDGRKGANRMRALVMDYVDQLLAAR